jgi:hypothetical protein
MKKFLLSVIGLAYTFIVFAGPVSENQALAKARQFMPGKSFRIEKTNKSIARSEFASNDTPYYVFNAEDNGGFVIVSGDDRTNPILGYSESGALDVTELPENVEDWLDYYAEAISSLGNSAVVYESTTKKKRSAIAPMIRSKWNQGSPYNDQCVFNGTRCLTGCVATAMAQIVSYYQYPNKVAAITAYTRSGNVNYVSSVPALPATTLDWDNMCSTYSKDNRTKAQKKAVATLMRYCGQSVYMGYGKNGSGAVTEYIASALVKYFGYAEGAQMIYRDQFSSDEEWEKTIYQELAGGRPVVYKGRTSTEGHAFVVDGYNKDGLYHVNWGWGGSCNGYFVLTVMNASSKKVYNKNQGAVIGIRPLVGKVKLDKSKATVEVGKTLTLKPTVSPSALIDKSVTWKSSDKSVATVTKKGKVKGIKAGKATITCISDVTGAKATCKVTVGSVILNKSEVSVKKGKTVTLKATVEPSSLTDKSVTWESSNTKIATVTTAGKVKGIKAGTATITCTSNATGLKATCTVTVTTSANSRSLDGDDDETTGIEENVVAVEPFDVYDLSGRKVLHQVTSLDGLPEGIYIVNGKKVLFKK